jgi:hypothetical protein
MSLCGRSRFHLKQQDFFIYFMQINCIYVSFLLCIKLNPGDLAYASWQIRVSNINENLLDEKRVMTCHNTKTSRCIYVHAISAWVMMTNVQELWCAMYEMDQSRKRRKRARSPSSSSTRLFFLLLFISMKKTWNTKWPRWTGRWNRRGIDGECQWWGLVNHSNLIFSCCSHADQFC